MCPASLKPNTIEVFSCWKQTLLTQDQGDAMGIQATALPQAYVKKGEHSSLVVELLKSTAVSKQAEVEDKAEEPHEALFSDGLEVIPLWWTITVYGLGGWESGFTAQHGNESCACP